MADQRAKLFESAPPEIDLSNFTPKAASKPLETVVDTIRATTEFAGFPSREPVSAKSPKKTGRRIWRTGRNVPFAHKVTQACNDGFYQIAEAQKWTMGETLERALGALQRELAKSES
jgi:hypothetical protein